MDSPIILGTVYKDLYNETPEYPATFYDDSFDEFIFKLFKKYNNFNILLKRDDTTYDENGRFQNLSQSKEIDDVIKNRLDSHLIQYVEFSVGKNTSEDIFSYILKNQL